MTDYVNCPACRGRGMIPLEDAEVLEAHDDANRSEARQLQRQREQEIARVNLARRIADAEERQRAMERVILGHQAAAADAAGEACAATP